MNTISHYDPDCQEEIPVEWPIWDTSTNEPTVTPLADLHPDGVTDSAALDAELMTLDEWLENIPAYELEPEYQYFEDEV
jgi:hypothetical protein